MHHEHQYPFGTLSLPSLDPNCRLSVTIPAKDEADYIVSTLESLRLQVDDGGSPLAASSYEVVVLANNCSDDTAETVRSYAKRHPTFRVYVLEQQFPPAIACVGTVRRLAMDSVCHRYRRRLQWDGVLVTTDADTRVDERWVFYTLDSVRRGARAVGGRILVPSAGERNVDAGYRKHHLQDVTYRSLQYCLESMIDPQPADPWPRHFQHFGPSTAVTVGAYLACGGLPPLRCLEDVGLVRALERADIPVTHDRRVKVYTSSRISNRVEAETNFSAQLDQWAALAEREPRVVGLENCRRLFKWKVALRHAVQRGQAMRKDTVVQLAETMGCEARDIEKLVVSASGFGQLYQSVRERLEQRPNFATTPISQAIRDLRRFTRSVRHQPSGTTPGDNGAYGPTVAA